MVQVRAVEQKRCTRTEASPWTDHQICCGNDRFRVLMLHYICCNTSLQPWGKHKITGTCTKHILYRKWFIFQNHYNTRYVRYTHRWRKKCTVLHRIQWRIWCCTKFGDKFSTDFFTVLKKAYFSMTILSLNSLMIYWRLIHHWIRWWKLVNFLLWFFGSPNSVHMFALKLMKMILVKNLAPNSVKNYVLHWIPLQIKNTSHAHNVCF